MLDSCRDRGHDSRQPAWASFNAHDWHLSRGQGCISMLEPKYPDHLKFCESSRKERLRQEAILEKRAVPSMWHRRRCARQLEAWLGVYIGSGICSPPSSSSCRRGMPHSGAAGHSTRSLDWQGVRRRGDRRLEHRSTVSRRPSLKWTELGYRCESRIGGRGRVPRCRPQSGGIWGPFWRNRKTTPGRGGGGGGRETAESRPSSKSLGAGRRSGLRNRTAPLGEAWQRGHLSDGWGEMGQNRQTTRAFSDSTARNSSSAEVRDSGTRLNTVT